MTLPVYTHLGGDRYRATWEGGAYLDVEVTRERSWPGIGAGDPPGELHRPLYEWAARAIGRGRGPRSCVVDVGCGSGYGTRFLSRWCGSPVVGVDVDMAAVAFARHMGCGVSLHFEAYSVFDVPGFVMPADAIVCIEVIEHIEDDRGAVRAMFEALLPGGLLCLTTPEHHPDRTMSPFHAREYTEAELRHLLSGAGFVGIERHKHLHFGESLIFTARKP